MLGLLLSTGGSKVSIGPEVACRLSGLGVTHVSFLGDEAAIVVILEGWAFDPSRLGAETAALVAGGPGEHRALRPLAHVSL